MAQSHGRVATLEATARSGIQANKSSCPLSGNMLVRTDVSHFPSAMTEGMNSHGHLLSVYAAPERWYVCGRRTGNVSQRTISI